MKTPTTTTDPKLYIGLDIHKRSWKIHTATDIADGRSFSSPPDPDALWSYVSSRFPKHEVFIAYEAGCCDLSLIGLLKLLVGTPLSSTLLTSFVPDQNSIARLIKLTLGSSVVN